MSDAALAARAHANMLAAIRAWARAAGGDIAETEELLVVTAPAPLRSFNQMIVSRLAAASAVRLRQAVADLAGRAPKFRLRALETAIAGNEQLILDTGLEPQGGIPSLALSPIVDARVPSPLDVRTVTDDRTLHDHAAVVGEAFGWQTEDVLRVFTPKLLEQPGVSVYVGYADGAPAATCQLVADGGVAGLYYVGTAEAHRRRGYAEAVTAHAIAEGARLGCDIATLQASPAGYPVYKRLGFRDVGYYRTYVPAA